MAVKTEAVKTSREQKAGKGRVLIVDDERDFVHSLVDVLESRGYEVEVAFNAREAQEKITRFDSQVALLDIRLGRDSGIDLIPRLTAERPGILSVMMTAYAATDTAIEALQEGAYDYLRKPLDAQELLATLERCFEKIRLEKEKTAAEETLKLRNRELEEINSRLRRIVDSSRGFATCASLSQLGPLLLEEFAGNMAAEGGSLFLARERSLILVHTLDPGHVPDNLSFPLREHSPFQRALENGEPILVQDIAKEKLVTPSGWSGYKNGSLLVVPLRDETGDNLGVISLHNKIPPPFTPQDRDLGMIMASYACETLRATQAIEALKRSEQRYRLLAENTTDIIWTMDMSLEYTYVSPSVERLCDYKPEELVGRSVREFLAPESFEIVLRHFSKELAREKAGEEDPRRSMTLELEMFRKDGSTVWTEVQSSFLRSGGGSAVGVIGVTRDIGYRKELERQLRQSQKMEAIGTLAGGIAHDFNNILAAILGYVEISMLDVKEGSQAAVNMEKVLNAGKRAKDLVKQILAFSRRSEQERKPVPIGPIVREALKLLRASLPTTIEIKQKIERDTVYVKADPTQIHQVVMNLCTNAAHAMRSGGGMLEMTLEHAEVDPEHISMYDDVGPGPYIRLTVCDTGHGMDQETMERIFDPYFTTKETGEGTGLGLSMVHGIVKNHGGIIAAESRSGKGSSFYIYLPIVVPDGEAIAETMIEPHPRGTERILLVDDEESLVDVGMKMMEHLGYTVIPATSSRKALELFSADPEAYDAVFTDMTMPGMTGDRLADEIRQIRSDVGIVICTGYSERLSDRGVAERTAGLGRIAFMMKPLSMGELARTLRKVLDS